ncbi:uncharacterized protein ASCRUDRAFT_6839 [Ascoidea rubescens DSM 1968]|uniref:FAS1 domain-containing protein n=1 Tax=Ascoidea rubescens DSM 1968 TaxID=1344418 RepID=A0A1D2VKU2_9ASCO|nr:hypothetical protein ASCRUDRAFT_6839 [Ascoidea rubescens DSM 1968]ODV62231.1 hypothetical protein ASCRUDRAFT_6839 [Ascoidea rubescens DSM 1968]
MRFNIFFFIFSLGFVFNLSFSKNIFDPSKFKDSNFDFKKAKRSYQTILTPKEMNVDKFTSNLISLDSFRNKQISVFSYYLRDHNDLLNELLTSSLNNKINLIIFVPVDSQLEKLPLKPWEFPTKIEDDKYTEKEIDEISSANVQDFIKSHIVNVNHNLASLSNNKEISLITLNDHRLVFTHNHQENTDDVYFVKAEDSDANSWFKVVESKEIRLENSNLLVAVIDGVLDIPSI